MKSHESKSAWAPPSEKPNHYTYLKEFRVEQCQAFLQHKCTAHRPFQCFNWHFLNQRRRRPIRRRDGEFNYSPDEYCTKFDENTGLCPDGDECPKLHRTAGDTERRYHLRYYKTGVCVHDTDTRGLCVKNGAHCAFAHGPNDVRPPVYDIRELQALESGEHEGVNGIGPISIDKERNATTEEPRWLETSFVLANYKTEPCKKPPRLCRQGYACPQYHNSRDKRRPPKKFKYRSTACPNVKHGDEWGEPSNCDSGDACQYCHSRTEQQFHPEIYKSTKCNDVQQSGSCPRGAFCAFAHVDHEMTQIRDSESCTGTSLADILQSALPPSNPLHNSSPTTSANGTNASNSYNNTFLETKQNATSSCDILPMPAHSHNNSLPQSSSSQLPIGSKPRHYSGTNASSSHNTMPVGSLGRNSSMENGKDFLGFSMPLQSGIYAKAPGSEREDKDSKSTKAEENVDPWEKEKRKRMFSFNVSPLAAPFYPTSDTVQSVVGSALDDLNIDDSFKMNSLDKDFDEENSISNSIGKGVSVPGSSAPVNIPKTSYERSMLQFGQSPSSTSSPGYHQPFLPSSISRERDSLDQNYMRTNGGIVGSSGGLNDTLYNLSSGLNPMASGLSQSPMIAQLREKEVQRLCEEILFNRAQLATWEESNAQARSACIAWKREVEDAKRKLQIAEQAKEEALMKLASMQKDIEVRVAQIGGIPSYVQSVHPQADLESLPLPTLKALHNQLKSDILHVEKVLNNSLKNEQWHGVTTTW